MGSPPVRAAALLVACVTLLLSPARAAPRPRVEFTDPALRAAFEQAVAGAGKPRLFHENLPASRPLEELNRRWNWYSSGYDVFVQPSARKPDDSFLGLRTVDLGNLPAGVLNLTLEWKPLPRLNAEMMEWLFNNLHKTGVSPFDGKTYPLYTLLHPVDHIKFLAEPADRPVTRGSTFTFMENPNSRCEYQPASFEEPWVCRPGRKGYVLSTPEAEWRPAPQTNATLVVERLDRHACVWHKTRQLPHFGLRTSTTTKLWWRDTPDGLVLSAARLAGVMRPDAVDEFETTEPAPGLLQQANEVLRVAYLDGNFAGNVTSATYWFALHWAAEWTGLQDWLPQVFAAARAGGRA